MIGAITFKVVKEKICRNHGGGYIVFKTSFSVVIRFCAILVNLICQWHEKKEMWKICSESVISKNFQKYNKDHLSKLASCFNLLYNWNKIFFWNFVALLKFFRTKLDIIQIFSIVSFANFVGSLFLSYLKLISGGLCSLSHTRTDSFKLQSTNQISAFTENNSKNKVWFET